MAAGAGGAAVDIDPRYSIGKAKEIRDDAVSMLKMAGKFFNPGRLISVRDSSEHVEVRASGKHEGGSGSRIDPDKKDLLRLFFRGKSMVVTELTELDGDTVNEFSLQTGYDLISVTTDNDSFVEDGRLKGAARCFYLETVTERLKNPDFEVFADQMGPYPASMQGDMRSLLIQMFSVQSLLCYVRGSLSTIEIEKKRAEGLVGDELKDSVERQTALFTMSESVVQGLQTELVKLISMLLPLVEVIATGKTDSLIESPILSEGSDPDYVAFVTEGDDTVRSAFTPVSGEVMRYMLSAYSAVSSEHDTGLGLDDVTLVEDFDEEEDGHAAAASHFGSTLKRTGAGGLLPKRQASRRGFFALLFGEHTAAPVATVPFAGEKGTLLGILLLQLMSIQTSVSRESREPIKDHIKFLFSVSQDRKYEGQFFFILASLFEDLTNLAIRNKEDALVTLLTRLEFLSKDEFTFPFESDPEASLPAYLARKFPDIESPLSDPKFRKSLQELSEEVEVDAAATPEDS